MAERNGVWIINEFDNWDDFAVLSGEGSATNIFVRMKRAIEMEASAEVIAVNSMTEGINPLNLIRYTDWGESAYFDVVLQDDADTWHVRIKLKRVLWIK